MMNASCKFSSEDPNNHRERETMKLVTRLPVPRAREIGYSRDHASLSVTTLATTTKASVARELMEKLSYSSSRLHASS